MHRVFALVLVLSACRSNGPYAVDADTSGGHDAVAPDAATEEPAQIPDLRFRWVGAAPSFHMGRSWIFGSAEGAGTWLGMTQGGTRTPLQIPIGRAGQVSPPSPGAASYVSEAWMSRTFETNPPVEALVTNLGASSTVRFETELREELDAGAVVTSFDLATAERSRAAYAMITVRAADGRQLYEDHTVANIPRGELQSFVAREAEGGKVVTALSGDAAQLTVFAFSWLGDAQSYEARAEEATFEGLETKARDLSDAGYTITAFGRDVDTLLLVGTRRAGSVTPRSIEVLHDTDDLGGMDMDASVVAWAIRAYQDECMILQR